MKKPNSPPKVFSFGKYLRHIKKLRKEDIDISKTGQRCADIYRTGWHNLQGHVKQSFYGVQRFLQENPIYIARIAKSDINSPYPLKGQIKKTWIKFLKTHRKERTKEYDIGVLYNITPEAYGGRTTTGGGAIAFIKRSLPIVSRMMLSGPYANPDLLAEPEGESTEKEMKFREEKILRRVRDTEKIRQLKVVYNYACQVCGKPEVQIGPTKYYAEGHHLKPLGKPHNGEDHESNIIILCPNHHILFDRNVMAIDPKDGKTVIYKFSKKRIAMLLHHKLDSDNIRYHYQAYMSS